MIRVSGRTDGAATLRRAASAIMAARALEAEGSETGGLTSRLRVPAEGTRHGRTWILRSDRDPVWPHVWGGHHARAGKWQAL